MRKISLLVLTIAVGMTACDSAPVSLPLSPSPPQGSAVQPALSVAGISGFVLDTGFRPLPGGRVEVVDGPHAGTSATVGATGEFSLSGRFDRTTRFMATIEGHVAATQTWSCSVTTCSANGANPWLGFYLAPLAEPVNIAGDYTLRFVADSACTELPNDVRTRTYAATITQASRSNVPDNTSFDVAVSGAPFLERFNSFSIGVAGEYLGFWLHGGHDPPVVEQLAPNTYLAFSGNARASLGATTPSTMISAPFEGWIEYCELKWPMSFPYNCGTSPQTGLPIPGQAVVYTHCESNNHRLTLTRR
jgi:hypothetical protein